VFWQEEQIPYIDQKYAYVPDLFVFSCTWASHPINASGILLLPKGPLTVRLTSVGNPVPGYQEFQIGPSKPIVGQVDKIRSFTWSMVQL
jgi:hypothetical protein